VSFSSVSAKNSIRANQHCFRSLLHCEYIFRVDENRSTRTSTAASLYGPSRIMTNDHSRTITGPVKKRTLCSINHFKAKSQAENPTSLLLLVDAVDTIRKDQQRFRTISPLLKPTFPMVVPSSPIAAVDQVGDDGSQESTTQRPFASTTFVPLRLNHVHYSKPTNGKETPLSSSARTGKVKILYRPLPMSIGRPLYAPPKLLSGLHSGEIRGC
jgi:hypothetical protein